MIPLLLAFLPQAQAVGLEPDERFAEIAPAPSAIPGPEFDTETYGSRLVHGRLIDAFTGRPIVGGTVESWTEEICGHSGGFARVGEAQSRADGRFSLQVRSGTVRADKARCYAPGYLTLSTTTGEVGDVVKLFPAPDEPTRMRVVDLRDRSIPGVLFTSTRTCSHDAPAFQATTDARGIVELHGFGLQSEIPDLRVRAPGRDAIEYADGEPAIIHGVGGEPWTLYLPRQRPGRVRVLDRDGQPFAHAPVWLQDGECYHVVRSDEEGWCELTSRYGHGTVQVQILDVPQNMHFHDIHLPSTRVVTLRPDAWEWPEETPTGEIIVCLSSEPAVELPLSGRVPFQVCLEDGWCREIDRKEPKPVTMPAGRGFLLFGGPFSGWEEEVIDFDLSADEELTLSIEGRRQPLITVLAHDVKWQKLWVQAGDSTFEDAPIGKPFAVTGGQPVCFLLRSAGVLRRLWIDEAVDGMEVDLRPDELRIQNARPDRPWTSIEVRVNEEDLDEPDALFVDSPVRNCDLAEYESTVPGRFAVEGPAGAPFLVGYKAEGYVTTWARGCLPNGNEPAPALQLDPVRYAKVELVVGFEYELPDFGRLDLDMLCPGPLHLVLQRDDGRRYALELNLEPGAVRRVEVKE
jgi:hypothetical protein